MPTANGRIDERNRLGRQSPAQNGGIRCGPKLPQSPFLASDSHLPDDGSVN
jgi:hypothetical protein